jgi:hypothetical protein
MILPPIRKKCRTVHFAKQALKFILSSTRNPTSALVVTRTRSRIRPHPPPLLLSLYSPPPSARRAPYREKADFMVQPGDKSPDPASARLDPVAVRPDAPDPVAARTHPRSSRGWAFLAVADAYDAGRELKQLNPALEFPITSMSSSLASPRLARSRPH